MNFGVRGHDTAIDNISKLAEKLEKAGITHIQLALKKSIPGFKEHSFSPGYAKSIADTLKSHGISISVLGCYINPSATNEEELKKELDYFEENLKYAKFMDAHMVGLETGFVGEELDISKNKTEEAYQHLLKNMRHLTDIAQKLGVMIGIEGVHCYVINDSQRMRRLIDDLNSPNICVIFDPVNLLNIHNYKNQDKIIREAFDVLGDEIGVIHLKDFRVEDNMLKECIAGEGILNTDLLLALAKEKKPEIEVVFELVSNIEYPRVIKRFHEF